MTTTMPTSVLVIEDDQEINELLGEYLSLEQMEYVQALNGKEGLRQASERHPDAVILDLMLPDIDGYEIARQLTSHRATFDIPVVLLTCMNQQCDREKGFAAGALHFMNKPFLPDDLIGTLKKSLEWKMGLKERAPAGVVPMAASHPMETSKALNGMMADLFTRTSLSDAQIGQIREGFENLAAWSAQWGKQHQQDSQLSVTYRVLTRDHLAAGEAATAIEWTLSESKPGLIAAAFFTPVPVAQPASEAANPNAVLAITGWAFGKVTSAVKAAGSAVGVGGGGSGGTGAGGGGTPVVAGTVTGETATDTVDKTPSGVLGMPHPAGTGANWFAFLGKVGAARFDRNAPAGQVTLVRQLSGEGTVPVFTHEGSRYPHRLREEAIAAKRK